ncbi:MAG: glycosyltransferase family 39 protein [Thermoanaerobaculia bacterium]|nr:glycosyltransferase family 39 protein [Thermoanaerobaculia bacterium]
MSRPRRGRAHRGKAKKAAERDRSELRRARWTGVWIFVLALALRLLFWQATPDASWPHSAHFKGDAPTWAAYAQSLQAGSSFELGLPLRPPGTAYFLAAVWDGQSSLAPAQLTWCVLGALTVLLTYAASLRSFGYGVALCTGLLCALSHGLMVLSTSLNNETPYLFLVVCTLWLGSRWTIRRPSGLGLWAWGALHALACLVRVEHLLFFLLTTIWLGIAMPPVANSGAARRRRLSFLAHVSTSFVLVLLPWHLEAWSAIDRFNREPPDEQSATAAAQSRLERALGEVSWTAEATEELAAIPAFARRPSANFVAATKIYRSTASPQAPMVERSDLDALDHALEAEPLGGHPFVTFYGGLNFYLAHNPRAEVGFSRAALDQPPLLDGRFPPFLVGGLPPADLAFTYPPHLYAVNHGYATGLRYIASEPLTTARRLALRAVRFWDGAALGFGGWGIPATGDLLRGRADLAIPAGGMFRAWQVIWLVLVVMGLVIGLRSRGKANPMILFPWLALALTKLAVSLAFFGYARHGAGAYPTFALLAALAVTSLVGRRDTMSDSDAAPRRLAALGAALGLAFLMLEAWRFGAPPRQLLDERGTEAGDPWPTDIHEVRILTHDR